MRAAANVGPYDYDIISLPSKMGGMGILSHKECSIHARAAAIEAADIMLKPILDENMEDGEDGEVKGQGERCKEMLEARRDAMMDRMDDLQRKSLVENGSVLGRRWLTAIPYNSSNELSNFEISCGLHYRTLHTPHLPCIHCGNLSLGHDELCRAETKSQWQISRHNGIVHAIADALSTIKLTTVQIEPATTDHSSRRRNDIRVIGSHDLGDKTTEHDVKVYTALGDKVHKSLGVMKDSKLTKAPRPGAGPWEVTLVQLGRYMEDVSRETRRKMPGCVGEFSPLVFTSGGLVEGETEKRLEGWKVALSGVAWEMMVRRMSLSLLRSRARTWEVRVG